MGPYYNGVTPAYFATMGMQLVTGRGIHPEDRIGSPNVVVVNQRLADFF